MTGRRQNLRRRIERTEECAPQDPVEVVVVWDDRDDSADPVDKETEALGERPEKQPRKGPSKSKPPDPA